MIGSALTEKGEKMSDEYIKKEDAVNLFEALADSLDTFEFRMAAIGAANELRKMPSMCFAPVRHGHWIVIDDLDFDTLYRCSVCGEEFYLIDGTPRENQYYYCPNCGARMDGDDNEID